MADYGLSGIFTLAIGGNARLGLLARHQMRREVVMPGREVRLALDGPSFGPGEFFEILRFPPGSGHDGFFVRQNAPIANLTSQRENRLLLHDFVTGLSTSIAGQVGLHATDFTFHFLGTALP